MPELPEVDTVVSDLNEIITGKRIRGLFSIGRKNIKFYDDVSSNLTIKQKIKSVERRGKYILIHLNNNSTIVVHLRMTGQLLYLLQNIGTSQLKHIRAVLNFSDDSKLVFNDTRNFGEISFFQDKKSLTSYLSKLGREPLEIKNDEFVSLFKNKKGNIKANLLRQDLICGIGNIYADESLFLSQIHPQTKCTNLSEGELLSLIRSIKKVLKNAIDLRGTSMRDYLDVNGNSGKYSTTLNVYGRTKIPCKTCGNEIQKIKVAGRGTHFCPNCQQK